jgi:hypothetical protein
MFVLNELRRIESEISRDLISIPNAIARPLSTAAGFRLFDCSFGELTPGIRPP